jgi:hypothetical protein
VDDEIAHLVEACRRSGLELCVHLWVDRPASFSLAPMDGRWPDDLEHWRSRLRAHRYEVRDFLAAEAGRAAVTPHDP